MNNFIISDEDGSSPSFAVRNFSTEKNHFGSSYTVNQLEIKNRERLRLRVYLLTFDISDRAALKIISARFFSQLIYFNPFREIFIPLPRKFPRLKFYAASVFGIYRQSIGNFENAYSGLQLITRRIERCN